MSDDCPKSGVCVLAFWRAFVAPEIIVRTLSAAPTKWGLRISNVNCWKVKSELKTNPVEINNVSSNGLCSTASARRRRKTDEHGVEGGGGGHPRGGGGGGRAGPRLSAQLPHRPAGDRSADVMAEQLAVHTGLWGGKLQKFRNSFLCLEWLVCVSWPTIWTL